MRNLVLLLALALLAPGTQAAPTPEFPPPLEALMATWVAEAEAMGAGNESKAWYPEAQGYLDSAKAARDAGRLRSVLFDLETYTELLLAGTLIDQSAALAADAERKTMILQRTAQWHGEATDEWISFRGELRAVQNEIRSVQGMEVALYATELGMGAALLLDDRETIAREFPKQASVDRSYVLALVRTSHTAVLGLGWAEDVLGAVSTYEGLPPRLNLTAWSMIEDASLVPRQGSPASQTESLDALAAEAQQGNETLLSIVAGLAQDRATRATSIFVIYGDATSRGKDVVGDATRSLGKQLNNTTMDEPRSYGLLGVFTADAIDRAEKTIAIASEGRVDLGTVITAWSGLDHQGYVTATLAAASPVSPPAETPNETPSPAWLVLAGLLVVALALRRR